MLKATIGLELVTVGYQVVKNIFFCDLTQLFMNELNFSLSSLSNLHGPASNLACCLQVNVHSPYILLTILLISVVLLT